MKKSFVVLLALLLTCGIASAQESGVKLAKSASRDLTSYNLDPANSGSKLEAAMEKIDQAVQQPDAQVLATTWITRGDIYNTRLQKDMGLRFVNPEAPLSGDNDALVAYEAYNKAYELADKKYLKTDAVKGMVQVQGHLINIGAAKFEAGNYDQAFISWTASLASHKTLKAEGQASVLDDSKQLEDQMYYTSIAATLSKNYEAATALYNEMIAMGAERAGVYEGLYQIKMETGDTTGAEAVLAEGRKKFPNDTGLLFSEINSYLIKGKMDELVDRLKMAIEKEPTNASLYTTLGSVYDNLYQRELKNNNNETADGHFANARKYYEEATKVDPKNADAAYALGALFYNKAALLTQEMNAMGDDFSAAAIKKYEAMKKDIMGLFDQALPHFQKAESLSPNDINTLIALKEIYARKEDPLYTEFAKRLENAQSESTKNKSSHFKN